MTQSRTANTLLRNSQNLRGWQFIISCGSSGNRKASTESQCCWQFRARAVEWFQGALYALVRVVIKAEKRTGKRVWAIPIAADLPAISDIEELKQ